MHGSIVLDQRRMPLATKLLEPFAQWEDSGLKEPFDPKPTQATYISWKNTNSRLGALIRKYAEVRVIDPALEVKKSKSGL